MFKFQDLLAPLAQTTFFEQYWKQQFLHLTGRSSHDFSRLFSLADVAHIFLGLELDALDHIQLVKNGKAYPGEILGENHRVDKEKLFRAYFEGHTIILNKIARYSQSVLAFCQHLETVFKPQLKLFYNINANMYLTPPNSQGLAPHFDRHHVFVIQLEGKKNWRIYQSVDEYLVEWSQSQRADKLLGQPVLEMQMKEGDVLYLPKGMMHQAHSTPHDFSLHLSIGIYTVPWKDIMHLMVEDIYREVE